LVSTSAIWYFCSVSAIVLVFHLLFGFCNLVSASTIWYFCSVSAIVLVFHLLFGFCNLVSASAIWYFCSVSAIVLVFYLLLGFCNLVSASTIWYFCSVSAIVLVFRLLFSFHNLVFELSFCKKKIKKNWSDILSFASAKSGILTFLQLLSWHLLPKRLFGYVGYLLIREFSFLILLL